MAWIRVESSVRTHEKFLAAGPAASWLWVCGVGYCQEGLTDGFIPESALDFLGVKHPRPLMERLVKQRLWDVVEGGWQVHDYLDENKTAEEVRRIKRARKDGGQLGGRPKVNLEGLPSTPGKVNLPRNPSTSPSTTTATTTATSPSPAAAGEADDERHDVAFLAFQEKYPGPRRKGGFLIQQCFLQQITLAGGVAKLMAALENHIASEQWSVPRMIPGMDVWLREERWRQELPAAGAATASANNPRTAGNVAALTRFIDRGRPGA